MPHPQKNGIGQASSIGKAGNEASKDKTDLGTSSIERNDMRGILDISAITKSPLMTTNNDDKNQSGNSTASSVDHKSSNKNLHKSNLIMARRISCLQNLLCRLWISPREFRLVHKLWARLYVENDRIQVAC